MLVRDHLITAMAASEYAAGEFIPSENELSKQFHLSRPTIRKALLLLEKDGLIVRQPGKGRIVMGRHRPRKAANELQLGLNILYVAPLNHFYTPAIMAIMRECSRAGIKLNLIPENDLEKIDKKALNGVLWMAATEKQVKQLELMADDRFPVVLINRISEKPNISYVSMDHQQGALAGVEYLAGCGHRNIAFVGGPCEEYPYQERLRGYGQALRNNNIPFNDKLILDIRYSTQIADQISAFLGKNIYSAVFINAAIFVLPVLNALKMLHKRIPEDVSVVCFDDIENEFEHYGPPLTSIRQLISQLGEESVKIFLKITRPLDDDQHSIKKILIPEMIVRQSCRKTMMGTHGTP
ncbi:MAG: GntR family transcriptional regulator [Verrucomicrobiota bacterium]